MTSGSRPGSVVNGHVFTSEGRWQPLRYLPPNATPPYYPGDVKNGSVFDGAGWSPFVNHQPMPMHGQAPAVFHPVVKKRGLRTGAWVAIIGGGGVLLLAVVALSAVTNKPAGPEAQTEFIAVVRDAQQAATDNGAQVVSAKVNRGVKVCDILPTGLGVKDWTGTVVTISDELGGDDAILKVELAEGIQIDADDGIFDTGIKPGTDIYQQVANLKEGQSVRFSGKFKEDETYCIAENSTMEENGLRTPLFGFKFESVR
ncbi:hypothetical protein KG112_18220 [Nocardioides sp. zg-ZUI104]|uniref:hypothetical protein n=1 Tax=Nocardioides faecalis TaxID=2803858 RepID=UPI001BCCF6D3|nr:hypothetical protein [Nocardioides faecalis]MBS4754741.1 hypothetical protein [Nocardioides faecalis]